jgi:Protein of unknown function (DUF1553)/Protein of unknown function (DUF1549)/Concanavalin A-like lectin/glucanases superfamily/Planctomycete cytochrome C
MKCVLDDRESFRLAQKSAVTFMLQAAAFMLLAGIGSSVRAVEPLGYNRDIRPILADHCFACHGPDSAARKADLRLDQRDAAIEMGAITVGEPDESELIARIMSDDAELVMPPAETKKKLTEEQKQKLKLWIKSGAEFEPHWSFIAPHKNELPVTKNAQWTKNAIDSFVLKKLEENGLTPNSEADARTLFRRMHLDITGLPPNGADVEAFVTDFAERKDAALSDWIDRLMKSTAWGEHRARYWLDAARYADTHGLHFDNYREMWPYRDWVIRSFNGNQPFDQFTVEQLAGDLLPNPTDDQLIATGFQRCNITTNEGGTIDEENLANYAVDRVQTFGWIYLGLTTNCGQCHDHKFDRFTMRDYYSLAAFFRNTTQRAKDGNVKDGRGPTIIVPSESDKPRWKALPAELATATTKRDERKKNARGDFDKWLASATSETLDDALPHAGLVVHVPLNEGAGDQANNLCAKPDSFRAIGTVTWTADGRLGPAPVMKPGGTFDLGGLGDFELDQKFSYGAWVKAKRNGVFGAILARMDEKGDYRGWDLWQNDRSFSVHIVDKWSDNSMKVSTRVGAVKPGKWQHVFATYDGSGKPTGIKIFVDGVEEKLTIDNNTIQPKASIRTKTPLRIGQRSDSQVFEDGAIQDVRIYDRTLSAVEVKSIADIAPLHAILATAVKDRTPKQHAALYDHYLATHDSQFPPLAKAVSDMQTELDSIKARSPVTHVQVERKDSPAMANILIRGAYDKPGDEVAAATPAALHPMPKGAPNNRLGLARWTIDAANPLMARVTVNRFWSEVFGRGIVTTPEDFGIMGAEPTHPELLDWLAVDFRENGWDVKRLFKMMLMSSTYRQSAAVTPAKLEKDRDNGLLSRGPRFRMDAEMVRDYALSSSGMLSTKMYGPGTKPYQPEGIWDIVGLPSGNTRVYTQDSGENLYRRSVYNFWKRMAPPPSLEAFNAPSREFCTVQRERTNTPLQALVTLNDPQFVEAARHLAELALENAGDDDDASVIDFIARHVLCRPVNDGERAIIAASKKELLEYYQAKPEDAASLISVGDSKVDEKLDVAKLAAWTMVCNQVMNLDEVLNK